MTSSILDHRLLQQFLAVVDAGSVRRGAARLHISQPPLTQAIRRLEDGLGVTLFDRQPKGMVPTKAGAMLATEARELLARIRRTEHRVRAAADPAAPLHIGFVSAALNGKLTEVLRYLKAEGAPRPVILEMTTPEQIDAIAAGNIDLGLLHPPVDADDSAVLSLGRDPFVAAVPSNHPLGTRKSLRFAQIAALPLVLFPDEQGPSLMGAIERLAFEAGAQLDVAAHAPRVHSQLAIVAAGIGIGLVTESIARTLHFSGVSYIPLSDTKHRLFMELALIGDARLVAKMEKSLNKPAI